MDFRLEVEGLVVCLVDPAEELAAFRRSHFRHILFQNRAAERDVLKRIQRIQLSGLVRVVHGHGERLGHPLGVEHHVCGGHRRGIFDLVLEVLIEIPAFKLVQAFLPAVRVTRFGNQVILQRCFVLHRLLFPGQFRVIVEEPQSVAVAGIAEVVVLLNILCLAALPHFTERRV